MHAMDLHACQLRKVELDARAYFSFAFSGAACTAAVRTALTPVDVAKTRMPPGPHTWRTAHTVHLPLGALLTRRTLCGTGMQSSPAEYPALLPSLTSLWVSGGLNALYKSVDVTAAAAFLLGGCGVKALHHHHRPSSVSQV